MYTHAAVDLSAGPGNQTDLGRGGILLVMLNTDQHIKLHFNQQP